ncbi:hypothetical protein [Embleya scabrispora]|uniref:hypothetical protein n=1 Tax=Embleya scabrispora TaxID=159449 RepID=UPI000373C905|nr:hypothetical protein [Embleya scabrispora]MYS85978.1 hypothetical protein [Streptomyces sp. SID5474]
MSKVAPILAAMVVAACSLTPDMFDGPIHDVTRNYLRAVAGGTSPAPFYGDCGGTHGGNAERALAGEGGGFTFSMDSSTQDGDSAVVNVDVTGQDHTASPYAVDLRRENGKWVVCGLDTHHVQINSGVDPGIG